MAAGRGRGRGAGINIPAWMASGDGPWAAQAAKGADAEAESGAATGAAKAVARAPLGPRPHPDNWESMTKTQKRHWLKRRGKWLGTPGT